MRLLFALAALILLATFAPPALQRPAPALDRAALEAVPVPLDRADPSRRRVGALEFLGGWSLESPAQPFGGISALHVEGGEGVAFSDSGLVFRFPLPPARGPVRIERLVAGPGPPQRKTDRDVEAAVVRGRLAWIGFERVNAVWRYDRIGWRETAGSFPAKMEEWEANKGAEAMLRLPDARFLVFSEGEGGESDAILFHGDPALPGTPTTRLRYRPPQGYRITDAALLPDGRMLLLNRRFRLLGGVAAKLTVADPGRLREGTAIEGREIAAFRPPMSVDNFEALAVAEEGGRTILWMASDDNFNPLQRTLLLKFALDL